MLTAKVLLRMGTSLLRARTEIILRLSAVGPFCGDMACNAIVFSEARRPVRLPAESYVYDMVFWPNM